MRLSQVCIDRPVLSWVMSIIILLFGAISLTRLPNRELPDIDEPIVIESIIGTRFTGKVAEELTFGDFEAVIPEDRD